MKRLFKRMSPVLLALVLLAVAVCGTGCSTPKVAVSVDGTDYSTGEYLAFLYNSFYNRYVNGSAYYYDLYYSGSVDVWNQTYTDEDGNEYPTLQEYIQADAKSTIVRQVALARLMEENGLKLSEEDEKEYKEYVDSLHPDAYLDYGIGNDSFARMYREVNYFERTLFYGLYGEGGKKAVAAEDIRKHFDENYLSYKLITRSLTDSEGKDLSEEEITAIDDALNGYLTTFNADGDFDALIEQNEKDTAEKTEEDTEETETEDEEPAEDEKTEETEEPAEDEKTEETEETEETAKDENRVDIDASQTGDKELVAALKEMAFGEAKVISYTTDSGSKVKALALRLDPEADRGKDEDGNDVDYFKDQHDNILASMKFDEFDKDVKAKMKTLSVTVNDRAIKAGDPYEFRSMFTN